MLAMLLDTIKDTLVTIPFLLIVYLLLGFLEGRLAPAIQPSSIGWAGPFIGALAGCIPQCGFSAASAALYNSGLLGAGTLIAVFLATSDEAIPILLANPGQLPTVLALLLSKVVIAILWGYGFYFALDRHRLKTRAIPAMAVTQPAAAFSRCSDENCNCQNFSLIGYAVWHTGRIAIFLLLTLLVINTLTFWIGDATLSKLLLGGTLWQPILAALVGLIPGCGTSVLLTTLFLNGTLSFGAAIAGLATGAGFGYLILLQAQGRRALPIIFCTFLAAAVSGIFLQIFVG